MFSQLPSYSYSDHIKTPQEMGMSTKGDWGTIQKNLKGLMEYKNSLIAGKSSATTQPYLGDKFFLDTGVKCTGDGDKQLQDRHIYINNVPAGYIMGRGLIPGVIEKVVDTLNPNSLMTALTTPANPPCQSITLQVKGNTDMNDTRTETHYVATADIKNIDECLFANRTNPITNKTCDKKNGFTPSMSMCPYDGDEFGDVYDNLFFTAFGALILYIFYRYYAGGGRRGV